MIQVRNRHLTVRDKAARFVTQEYQLTHPVLIQCQVTRVLNGFKELCNKGETNLK